ncbi:MAG: xanthine dehydrogenase family protein molybdopterin-binding subunit [Thaumarchaeota archaeon]|nr:xanthine dehydrogenase family protein molybdopterin-binding subunit [Candidatus Calditenuaceae archaeon]
MGRGILRREDLRFVKGLGKYVADLAPDDALHVALLRSPLPHAVIRGVRADRARVSPGVRLVVTGPELPRLMRPFRHLIPTPPYYPMAVDKVRFVGEPVAAVVAESRTQAVDALELIEVDYEPLRPVIDPDEALEGKSPLVHEGFTNNIAWTGNYVYGDVESAFRSADLIVSSKFVVNRFSSTPIEPSAVLSYFDRSSGDLYIYDQNHQAPMHHARLADVLKLPQNKLVYAVPDVGGGFGNKVMIYPYSALIGLLSIMVDRPVMWVADRREDMAALMQTPMRIATAEAAVRSDGKVLGLRIKLIEDFGAHMRHPEPQNVTRPFACMLGPYDIGAIRLDAVGVFTNKSPTGPNRAYGRTHTFFVLERLMDIISKRLGLDPVEIRMRNFIPTERMPYTNPIGSVYDGGNYHEMMRILLTKFDYEGWKSKREKFWQVGRPVGIGVAAIIEPAVTNSQVVSLWGSEIGKRYAGSSEAAMITVFPTGKVEVRMGTIPQGQGHETVAAQVVAELLQIPMEDVNVISGFNSRTHPYSGDSGTYASRFSVMAVGAITGAAIKIREKMKRIAANILGTDPEHISLTDGEFRDGVTQSSVSFREVCRAAYNQLALLPEGMEPGLHAVHVHRFESSPADDNKSANFAVTYSPAMAAAAVELDPETFEVKVLRLVMIEDIGTILNPVIAEGQAHGAMAHGLGAALYEQYVYDRSTGQLLSSTFIDYLVPTALEMPELEVHHYVTRSLVTDWGSRGGPGESGTPLVAVTIANAISDALDPLGVDINEIPITPSKLWSLSRNRERGAI